MNPVRNAGFVSGGNQYPQGEDHRHNRRWQPRPLQRQLQPFHFQPVQQYPSGRQVHTTPMPALAQTSVRVRAPGPGHGHGQYNNISFPPGGMFYPSIPPASQPWGFPGMPVIFHRYQAEGPRILPAPYNNISGRPGPAMLYTSIPPASDLHEAETRGQQEAEIPETPPTNRFIVTPEITKVPQKKMITGVVEYWFTPENLLGDDYLKARMDEEGWVPISFINTVPGLQAMNIDPIVVAENMQDSSQAEVRMEDLMIRKRGDWFNYLPHPP